MLKLITFSSIPCLKFLVVVFEPAVLCCLCTLSSFVMFEPKMFDQLKRNSCSSQIRLELNTVNFTFLNSLPGINFHSKNHSKTKLNHFTLVLEFPTERVSLSDKKCQNLFYVINIFHVHKKMKACLTLTLYFCGQLSQVWGGRYSSHSSHKTLFII